MPGWAYVGNRTGGKDLGKSELLISITSNFHISLLLGLPNHIRENMMSGRISQIDVMDVDINI